MAGWERADSRAHGEEPTAALFRAQAARASVQSSS